MTDISTDQQSLSLPTLRVRGPQSLAKRLKTFLSARRGPQLDARYASKHILKDTGIRDKEVRPISSLGRSW